MHLRRPFFKYFGSKWQSIKHYPAPTHPLIIEPFAGSATYSLRNHERQVILYDLDPQVIELWQWLISDPREEIANLPVGDLPLGADIRTLPGVTRMGAELMRRWQRVGNSGPYTISCWNNSTGLWGADVRDYLIENCRHISHWKAHCLSYHDIPQQEATWFIDPPYQNVRGNYAVKTPINYGNLSQWCRSLPGQKIVCEQQGADWLPFEICCEPVGMRGRTRHVKGARSKEMVWHG